MIKLFKQLRELLKVLDRDTVESMEADFNTLYRKIELLEKRIKDLEK